MAITGTKTPSIQAAPGIAPYSQRTVACWVKMPSTGTTNNVFFDLMRSSFSFQFNMHYSGNPTPNVFGSQCSSGNGSTIDGTGLSGISANVWHFILFTYDNGGVTGNVQTVKVYYDGVLNNTVTAGGPVTALVDDDPGSTLYIWAGNGDGGASVAYPMIWKRILSQSEITALAANGDPRVVAPANLVSFVQLNQGSGTFPDLVGPSINWVVTGGTFTVVADPFSLTQSNTPTTLSRASFSGQKGALVNLQLASMTSYAVGTALNAGPILGTITQLLPNNKVKLRVTSGPASLPCLLSKGTAIT